MRAADPSPLAERARRMLSRPGAWLEEATGGYAVRASADRRRRPVMTLGEGAFRELVAEPGLRPRPGGGYGLVPAAAPKPSPPPGKPGFIPGEKWVADESGRTTARAANLGESPVGWLAKRKDAAGQPFLTPAQFAAAERLAHDHDLAGQIGRLTMAWDAGPKTQGARRPGLDPLERGVAARKRLAAALDALGPGLQEIAEQICILGVSLEAAEKSLNLPRRAGKTVLRLALDRLVKHYGIG